MTEPTQDMSRGGGSTAPVVIDLHVEAFGDSRDEVFEVPRAEWDALTPAERQELAEDVAEGLATNYVSWGWNIADPDDYASVGGA